MPPRKRKAKAPSPSPSSIDLCSDPPTSIDPYTTLDLPSDHASITPDNIKSAYRRAALRHHPDKVSDTDKAAAHARFQEIAFAYAVLSDPARRARYDATGSTAEGLFDDDDDWSWTEYFRGQFRDAISQEAIEKFAREYKGSTEEKDDVLAAYEECEGDLDGVHERVMLCETAKDHARVKEVIDAAIESGDVQEYAAYTAEKGEQGKKRAKKRAQRAKAEEDEAVAHAKELGVHDKLFGDEKKKKSKEDGEAGLAALIQARQKERNPDAFFDHLLDKYGGGKKRVPEDGEAKGRKKARR